MHYKFRHSDCEILYQIQVTNFRLQRSEHMPQENIPTLQQEANSQEMAMHFGLALPELQYLKKSCRSVQAFLLDWAIWRNLTTLK